MSTWPSLSALIEQLDLLAEQVIYLNCKTNRCTIIGYRDSFGNWVLGHCCDRTLLAYKGSVAADTDALVIAGSYTGIHISAGCGENTAGSAGRLYLADWDGDRTLSDEPEAGASSQNGDDGRGVSVGREGETEYGE